MVERESSWEGQRREATVLFADISGFTAMSEKTDPEVVTDVMNACFALVERIVRNHGGTIDKFIGDAVMALFGAAHAVEHAPRRAVSAALEIRASIARFNREHELPAPLDVHIGVNSGLVIAGDVGGERRRDFTVMGDTVNLAARLEDASEKGQILVGPATFAHTSEIFEYRKLKPLALKGKAEPIQAYEVLGAKENAGVLPLGLGARHIASDLVGREHERALLRARAAEFLRGRGGIVSVVGDAGIGKSRLLADLCTAPELESATILSGRCDSVGSGLSFHPFVDLLRGWAGIRASDVESDAEAKLAAAIEPLLPTAKDEVLPFVATLMGVRISGPGADRLKALESDAMEKLVTKAMHDLFVALAAQKHLVILIEDLHWADLSSVKLLESLLRLSLDHRILFVFAYRPRFDETSDRIGAVARSRYAERNLELELEPLSERHSDQLIRNLLKIDSLPFATRQLITRKAEGNPFFIEEVIRALIDHAAVVVRAGKLEVTERIESVTIPGTVQEVILSRVEQVDERARRVLQLGAVIGRSFFHRVLAALLDGDEDLESSLSLLKERQLIVERQAHRTSSTRRFILDGEREYVFRHALIQETIYQSLLTRTRKELHRKVAEAIESIYASRLVDFYGMLALHYSRCEDFEKAEDYLFRAGEEAVRSAASSEALNYFREAYRIYRTIHGTKGDPKRKFQLEKSLATALLLTGRLSESRPHFDRALEYLGERVSRTPRSAYAQLVKDLARILTRVYVLRGRMSRRPISPELREALSLLYYRARVESVADPEWFLFDSLYMTGRLTTVDPRSTEQAFAQWAGVALLFSYSGISFAVSRRVARVARSVMREDRPEDLFTYHLMNFMRDYFEGSWDRPSGIDDALIERMTRAGHLWDVDTYLGMETYKWIDVGNLAMARARLAKIGEIVEQYGYEFAETNRMGITIFIAVAERRLDDAMEAVERYLERPEELLNLIGLGNKAKIELLLGRLDDARRTLDRADALAARLARVVTPFHSGWYRTSRLLLGALELERAKLDGDGRRLAVLRKRVLRDVKLALRTARVLAMIRTETYRLTGTIYWLLEDRPKAIRWWEASLREGARLGALPELARTHVEVARRLASPQMDRTEIAGLDRAAHLATARRLLAELGLTTELRMIDDTSARSAADPAELPCVG